MKKGTEITITKMANGWAVRPKKPESEVTEDHEIFIFNSLKDDYYSGARSLLEWIEEHFTEEKKEEKSE